MPVCRAAEFDQNCHYINIPINNNFILHFSTVKLVVIVIFMAVKITFLFTFTFTNQLRLQYLSRRAVWPWGAFDHSCATTGSESSSWSVFMCMQAFKTSLLSAGYCVGTHLKQKQKYLYRYIFWHPCSSHKNKCITQEPLKTCSEVTVYFRVQHLR